MEIFKYLIENINHYNTIDSLQEIVEKLDLIEDTQYSDIVNKIKNTIKGYGKNNNILTNKQTNNLIHVISQYDPNYTNIKQFNTSKCKSYKNYNLDHLENFIYKKELLDKEDMIYDIMMMFKNNLTGGLSSSITNIIVDYFDMIQDIRAIEPFKYDMITLEIEKCLKNHGWTDSGFYSEPNQIKLSQDIEKIIDKSFKKND